MQFLTDLFLNLDVVLQDWVAQYGAVIYALLFLIIFLETGLVVTPFLPGDSLLFVSGALAGSRAAKRARKQRDDHQQQHPGTERSPRMPGTGASQSLGKKG